MNSGTEKEKEVPESYIAADLYRPMDFDDSVVPRSASAYAW